MLDGTTQTSTCARKSGTRVTEAYCIRGDRRANELELAPGGVRPEVGAADCDSGVGQQSPSSSAARNAAYYLYSARTFDAHAKDHAQILNRYARTGQPVPKEVAEEQTAAIRRNVEAAKKDFDTLRAVSKEDPNLAKKVAELEDRLSQVEQSRITLQGTCEDMLNVARDPSKTGRATMLTCCTTMQKELQAIASATGAVVDRFRQQDEVERMWQQLKTESD
jgi:hypothetical protein